MAARAGRHGRWFDVLASVLIGVVVVGAALVPAVTANSGETTTIRGDVSVAGQRLAFFPVGFWTPGTGVINSTRTDANGVFTLDVPITRDGYAYAGSAPDATAAIVTSDGLNVVRGTIGAKIATPVSSPLYQGWDPATGRSLAGGAAQLHFALQQAGRIGGTSPVPASAVRALQVRRLDGSVVQTATLDARGRWSSRLLVPGRYAVALVPRAPLLPVAVQVEVQAGRVAQAVLPAPLPGATVTGQVRSTPAAAAHAVPVLLLQQDRVLARTTTDGTGSYRFAGLAAGDYRVQVGVVAAAAPVTPSAGAVPVPVPGRTVTPSPVPTATPPAPSPAPTSRAVLPVQRVSDTLRPTTTDVTVPTALGVVPVVTQAEAAGRLGGRVSGGTGTPVQVVVEDGDGVVVRTVDAAADGRYSVAGLVQGEQYRIWAVTRPDDLTLARMGTTTGLATESTSGVDLTLDRAAAGLQGTVGQATGGTVVVGDPSGFSRSSVIDASGAYAVQGLVPGVHPVVVRAAGRLTAETVAVQVVDPAAQAAGPQDLQRGPLPATYRGWFISGGSGVPLVSGTATSARGAVARFGPTTDQGHLTIPDLRPGDYAYDAGSFAGTAPAVDGPWWFDAPAGTFALSDGATTDVGPVVLHVRAN